MAADTAELKNRTVEVFSKGPAGKTHFFGGKVREGLSQISEIQFELVIQDSAFHIGKLIGHPMRIEVKEPQLGETFAYGGHCVGVREVQTWDGFRLVVADVRPWLWFLTLARNNRIFQEQSTFDIVKSVIGDHGFSADIVGKSVSTNTVRPYCVQYDETDFAFISRLLEEEGIHYALRCEAGADAVKMEFHEGNSSHQASKPGGVDGSGMKIPFRLPDGSIGATDQAHVFDYRPQFSIKTGKIALQDFFYEQSSQPTQRLQAKSEYNLRLTGVSASVPHFDKEQYIYPGRYTDTDKGASLADVRAGATGLDTVSADVASNAVQLRTGVIFELTNHPVAVYNGNHLAIVSTHQIRGEPDQLKNAGATGAVQWLEEGKSTILGEDFKTGAFKCDARLLPSAVEFSPPQITQWPRITGPQTATVTGKAGEEIFTDEFGRIKVRFHWDRLNAEDETSSCWVRCVMPWTGANWGMISVPRVGQEVVIEFEHGDPDRPICTGMVYNDLKKVPYTLPQNMTQTGIVTRSTKDGNADTFHELIFEDLKEKEFVRLQSERDWKVKIKNNAEITIGLEHQDPGDLTQTIHHSKTETIKTGDHNFTVETGNQTIHVEADHEETINGTSTQTIEGDTTQTVTSGDYTQNIEGGDSIVTISQGDHTFAASAGSIDISAAQEIKLSVGGSSITIDNSGITIEGTMITVTGNATVDVGSPSTTVKGDAVLTLKGGIVFIN